MKRAEFIEPTQETFEQDVLRNESAVLVEFWAPWCGPCRAMKPTVEAVGAGRQGLEVAFVNVDESPELAQTYGIQSIPALKLFRGGELVAERVGAQSRGALEAWLTENGA